jgi:uncharacterized membrane protein YoaK (UPF0700 family)
VLSLDRPRRWLAIAAATLAGFVDASGFLAADRYFVSFMSGNTTRLAVDLVEEPSHALFPAALIAGFVVGVILGSLLVTRAGPYRKPALLGAIAGLLALAAMARAFDSPTAMLGLLVLAMGALNNTFQREGEVAVGLTYMTGALVRIGQGIASRLGGKRSAGWAEWALLWLGLTGGAIAGAFVWIAAPQSALWLAACWALGLALLSRGLR